MTPRQEGPDPGENGRLAGRHRERWALPAKVFLSRLKAATYKARLAGGEITSRLLFFGLVGCVDFQNFYLGFDHGFLVGGYVFAF